MWNENFRQRVGPTRTAVQLHGKKRISCYACGGHYWHKENNLLNNSLLLLSFFFLKTPSVSSKTVWQSLTCSKPEPRVIMRVKVVLCALWSGAVWESLLLRVEVVAQVLESAAGEMLSAAGNNHCQEGGREWDLFLQDRTLNSLVTRPGLLWRL